MTQCNHDVSWAEPGLYAARAMNLIAALADERFPAAPMGASKHLASQHEFSKMGAKPPVIRASGGRREIARCAPPERRVALFACYAQGGFRP